MALTTATFSRDGNYVPIQQLGLSVFSPTPLTGTGAAIATPIFSVTGTVMVNALYGVVTTVLGNCTAASWRLNDQTATTVITAASGTALTGAAVGSIVAKKLLSAQPLIKLDAAAGVVAEPASADLMIFSPFLAVQKTGGIETDIEFLFTTSDNPATGAITFYCNFIPLTPDANVIAL